MPKLAEFPGVYGSDAIIEYMVELVVLPRLCQLCVFHTAVYLECAVWPDTYLCRVCLDKGESDKRRNIGLGQWMASK